MWQHTGMGNQGESMRARLAMIWFWAVCALGALAVSGCGEHAGLTGGLYSLEGVTVTELPSRVPGTRFYALEVEQPVDHERPGGPTFKQRVSLLHRDETAPMIVYTGGYTERVFDREVELTALLGSNQISIEHRFFGTSRPAKIDWSKLTIRQMADDEHAIIAKLQQVYRGAFVTAGTSKGGMTATYHRRFYPDDVDGTVAYVAPLSLGLGDGRYVTHLQEVGSRECRAAIEALTVDLLVRRWPSLLLQAQLQQRQYDLHYYGAGVGRALESAIFGVRWAFWQYYGDDYCWAVPGSRATDREVWEFLEVVSPVSGNTTEQELAFAPYVYQAYAQLGFPATGSEYLSEFSRHQDDDYEGWSSFPTPDYDAAAMPDIAEFVRARGHRLLFLYGEWDPWTAGRYELGDATEAAVLTDPKGSHRAQLMTLEPSDRARAFEMIEEWTGVRPQPARLSRAGGQRRRGGVGERVGLEGLEDLEAGLEDRLPATLLRDLRLIDP